MESRLWRLEIVLVWSDCHSQEIPPPVLLSTNKLDASRKVALTLLGCDPFGDRSAGLRPWGLAIARRASRTVWGCGLFSRLSARKRVVAAWDKRRLTSDDYREIPSWSMVPTEGVEPTLP